MILTLGKIVLYAGYLLIGFYLVLFYPSKNLQPLYHNTVSPNKPLRDISQRKLSSLAWISGGTALTLIPYWYVLISLLLSLGLHFHLKKMEKYVGYHVFTGLIFVTFLPWWLHNAKNRLEISLLESAIFLCTTVAVFVLFIQSQHIKAVKNSLINRLIDLSFLIGLLIVYATSISVALATKDFAQWHHWGAYIGPAELIYQGVYPLFDIPMQYGLGPSLAIASGCYWGCWNSLFWVVTVVNLIFALILAKIAIYLYEPRNWLERLLVLFIILLLCIFWLSHPISLQAPNAFPSGNGLRFLPGLLMLYLLLTHQRYSFRENQSGRKNLTIISIFLIWILSFAWSPEAGIHTSVLLVPYFFWQRLSKAQPSEKLKIAFSALFLLGITLLIGLFSLASIYFLILGVWPNFGMYMTYIVNPINPSSVNPNGPIWIVLLIIFLVWNWWRAYSAQITNDFNQRPILCNMWLVALLCFANFSYCLGRSSDGNFIAMLPYFLLAVLMIQRWSVAGANKTLATVLLASIIGWSALPAHINNYMLAFSRSNLISIDANRITAIFDRALPESSFFIKFDRPNEQDKLNSLRNGLNQLRQQYGEHIQVFDRYGLIDTHNPMPPWNALYGPANFTEIPSPLRRMYLQKVANRLNQSGWVMFDKEYREMDRYLEDYDTAYQRTDTIDFNHYVAIRYAPK